VELAEAKVGPSTVAKLLFTSGSTDKPKAVPNTHLMMCSNQAALAAVWLCLRATPPLLVDWLPWNHTFGGNFCFNLALTCGGTLHIDAGKPTPAHVAATLTNLRDVAPTLYFNVPAGFEALLPHLENDRALARQVLSRMHLIFSAGAALPQKARDRIEELVKSVRGTSIPILTGWGSTETAPCSTLLYSPTPMASSIGLPLPGTEVKLAPDQDKFELRVRGPNVMTGYWRQASAEAFDHEGFYRMGDAGMLADPHRPEAGIAFDGRLAENFKLRSGTWVNVGALRLAAIDATRPFVQDVVITGHDCGEICILIFPNVAECSEIVGPQYRRGHQSPRAPTLPTNRAPKIHRAPENGSVCRVRSGWRRRFAWHASYELLDLYKRIHREEPQLTGRTLYERVVIRRSGLDTKAATGVLMRAEQSFCDWPSGRDLRFRDVVQYVVVDEFLRSHVATLGTRMWERSWHAVLFENSNRRKNYATARS